MGTDGKLLRAGAGRGGPGTAVLVGTDVSRVETIKQLASCLSEREFAPTYANTTGEEKKMKKAGLGVGSEEMPQGRWVCKCASHPFGADLLSMGPQMVPS